MSATPPEIPISPRRRKALDRLEALHARGLWAFVLAAYLSFWIPIMALPILAAFYWGYIEGKEWTFFGLFGLVLTVVAWFLTPRFVRVLRRTPDTTPRQNEAWGISTLGFAILALALLWLEWILGLASRPVSEDLLFAATYAWLVGIVVMAWGLVSVLRARKTDPYRAMRSRYMEWGIFVLCAGWLILAAVTGLFLAILPADECGQVVPFVIEVKKWLPL